jgi:hypothetical protein
VTSGVLHYVERVSRALSAALLVAVAFASVGVSTGCTVINAFEDPALVGDWELDVNPETTMDIELNGDGDAVILAEVNGISGEFRYDLDWKQEDEDEFEIDFNCQESPVGCDQADFTMACEASSSGDNLDCVADRFWVDPDFEWSRD